MIAFVRRHVPHRPEEIECLLQAVGVGTLEELTEYIIPQDIRLQKPLHLPPAASEEELLREIRGLALRNKPWRTYIGMGYYGTHTPPVIQRLVLENPAWYSAYTPYQPEIAQGRLELLMLFQTMVSDLTGLPIANASLLDEATAGAEALFMFYNTTRDKTRAFFIDEGLHPQVKGVIFTRANALRIKVEEGVPEEAQWERYFGAILAYPTTTGWVRPHLPEIIHGAKASGIQVAVATDLLLLTVAEAPGLFGADVAFGSSQRFGVPLGYGGPHAAFFAAAESYKRHMPGRIVGLTIDAEGQPAYRLALQTREQHIRREKATSNICTAQVLLAHMATLYAMYHGPQALKAIALRIHQQTARLAHALQEASIPIAHSSFFDTLCLSLDPDLQLRVRKAASEFQINLRYLADGRVCLSLDETVREEDLQDIAAVFAKATGKSIALSPTAPLMLPQNICRESPYLTHPAFHQYHGEHQLTRFLHRLVSRDISLVHSMIPLGSCTMKLNPVAALMPLSWRELQDIHPFVPPEQAEGYQEMLKRLEAYICEITGFSKVSFQPNSGAQGEYTGLLVIRRYHEARGEGHRDIVLVPSSAHGTNPASAVLAGYQVVVVRADERGSIDKTDLQAKVSQYRDRLAALMVTYPSTHGIYERHIRWVCETIHQAGGQVYMDGANLNAQVGLTSPSLIGADVCHLNLHKTFAIPHGGGGPGMGPIAVAAHLAPYLPTHPVIPTGGTEAIGPVSAAPYGSALILWISYAYIRLMGADGLRYASQIALLNANYLKARLASHYPILYTDENGFVAHEFIIDLRSFKTKLGIEVEDIAKRLMDFGFHAPTISFPVPGTLMIEPTESEDPAELDRFVQAMRQIREEIARIERGEIALEESPLRRAPHTQRAIIASEWSRPYSREEAAFPAPWLWSYKFWPPVARVDHAYGDRHLVCVCPPTESYASAEVSLQANPHRT
ncbi:MAG: aminomethyl-transferring glycine dehydrogenase [Bacteroidia bacterium]|nr:aminomethyl-transferring glycine dehydrogenase [Bacteroidia bacterium]MDW8014445.1 aminomethyl-transferring glycine dehydrogenase [Bacteroidia bacterium]